MKNLILTDFVQTKDWSFCKSLSNYSGLSFDVLYNDKGLSHHSKWKRILTYFTFPLEIYKQRKEIRRIVAWQQFFGLMFAFYSRLFHSPKFCKVYVMTFIYKPKKGIIGIIYQKVLSFILKGEYIDKLIVFSKNEIEYYSKTFNIPNNRFFYTPLTISESKKTTSDLNLKQERYVFSTGRSNRDYDLLLNVFKNIKHPLHIACNTLSENCQSENVYIYTTMFKDEMRKHMFNSYCVAIALKDPNISSGQLVFLQAMQMGKPIICTRCSAVSDYLIDGYNALLVNTESEWEEAIERLYTDCELYNRISKNSYYDYLTKYSSDSMAKSIGQMIKEDMA